MAVCTIFGTSTCWKERTKLDFFLISLLVLTLALTLCATIWLFVSGNEVATVGAVNKTSVCTTEDCFEAASRIRRYMNSSVDPCEDFYQFACGNFLSITDIPADKFAMSSFDDVKTMVTEKLRILIDKPIEPNEPKPFQLIKKLYKTCMNENLMEKDGLKSIKSVLKKMGGWPVLEGSSWNESAFSWMNSVYMFKQLGYDIRSFISFSLDRDMENSSRITIYIDQRKELTLLNLPRGFLNKRSVQVPPYFDYMLDVAVLFGVNRQTAYDDLVESYNFEMQLRKIEMPTQKNMDPRDPATKYYSRITVEELQRKFPSIQWLEFINTILAPDGKITSKEVVIVRSLEYIKEFLILISNTSKRVQANYVMWEAVEHSLTFLSKALRKRKEDYLLGPELAEKINQARWKECTDISKSLLNIAAGAIYVKNYFNNESRQNVLEMVSNIRAEFQDILEKIKWLDEKTKKHALAKAENMFVSVGYPEEILDNTKLEEYYRDLELDENNFLKSVLNVTIFKTRLAFKNLKKLIDRTDWVTYASESDKPMAGYEPHLNALLFTAVILQGIIFNPKLPQYMNYGAIGFVIGHEITHGFDTLGSQFDKNGNLRDWWTPETKKAFIDKTLCLIEQYDNYVIPEVHRNINGTQTLRENIADNGGLKEAYLAYNRWVKRYGSEKKLPGLNYSPNQLFWISSANMWCTKYRPEIINFILATDIHAFPSFRIIGPLSNLNYFAQDFNCPLGSKMNPKHKCSVW